jgi:hypothetical protein
MKTLEQALEELKDLIEFKIKEYKIPYTDGKVIRIDHILIRPSKQRGYIVIDTTNNKLITTTFSKVAAIAAAKVQLTGKSLKKVIHYDQVIEKNYNDSTFYFNTIEKTDDATKKRIIESRLEISQDKINDAKYNLDCFILEERR